MRLSVVTCITILCDKHQLVTLLPAHWAARPLGLGLNAPPLSLVLWTQELARQTQPQQGEDTSSLALPWPLSTHRASDKANSKARCLSTALGPPEAQGTGLSFSLELRCGAESSRSRRQMLMRASAVAELGGGTCDTGQCKRFRSVSLCPLPQFLL